VWWCLSALVSYPGSSEVTSAMASESDREIVDQSGSDKTPETDVHRRRSRTPSTDSVRARPTPVVGDLAPVGRGADTRPDNALGDAPAIRPPIRKIARVRPRDHGPGDDGLRAIRPFLASYLYSGTWDGIQPRDPATLAVRTKGGEVILTLRCGTEGQAIEARGWTWDGALDQLEIYCETGEGPWVELKFGTGHQKAKDWRKKEIDKRIAGSDNEA
jgi:hypothetical protein